MSAPRGKEALTALLRAEGERRYHDRHPFHVAMHAGLLTKRQIQAWVENRYYYQTRIPKKDAILLSKSDDPAFRRGWIRRIVDHDGVEDAEAAKIVKGADGGAGGSGGLAMWERLAVGVGLDLSRVKRHEDVLAQVRFACDAYVSLVERSVLVVGVASSLTEFFSPDVMTKRILAWETHYPWVSPDVLEYFRARVPRARADSREAIDFVTAHAVTRELEDACIEALVEKCRILWALLDAVTHAYGIGP